LLEKGDALMLDKGFLIHDILAFTKVYLGLFLQVTYPKVRDPKCQLKEQSMHVVLHHYKHRLKEAF